MKKITQQEFNKLKRDEHGYINCSTGDYSEMKTFPDCCLFDSYCKFGSRCLFGSNCKFDLNCNFGSYCNFGSNCNFSSYCNFGSNCKFDLNCNFGSYCNFGSNCNFDSHCNFSSYCNFDTYCSFGSLPNILDFTLGKVSPEICLELMRRDADNHIDPTSFNIWGQGGDCPYLGEYKQEFRLHTFIEKRELWKSGKPIMRTRDLVTKIMEEKNWILREEGER